MMMAMMMTMAVMVTIEVTMATHATIHDMLCGLGERGRREGEKEREEGYTRKGAW